MQVTSIKADSELIEEIINKEYSLTKKVSGHYKLHSWFPSTARMPSSARLEEGR